MNWEDKFAEEDKKQLEAEQKDEELTQAFCMGVVFLLLAIMLGSVIAVLYP